MIVVVGRLAWRQGERPGPAGRACEVALAAAALEARVELVGRAGDDRTGDDLMLALSRAGIGHVAVLRDPARPTPVVASTTDPEGDTAADVGPSAAAEPAESADPAAPSPAAAGPALDAADVSLGLQYLTAFGVLVVADDVPVPAVHVAVEAASFSGAHLVLLARPDSDPADVPGDATVLAVPPGGDDGAFARLVGAYAAGLDGGADPGVAFAGAVESAGWEALEPSA